MRSERREYDSLVPEAQPSKSFVSRFKYPLIGLTVLAVAVGVVAIVVVTTRLGQKDKPWEQLIETSNVMSHLSKLQAIADANNNNRASNTLGYNQSVEYVVATLTQNTNYHVVVQNFTYGRVNITSASNLNITSVSGITYVIIYEQEFSVMGSTPGTHDVKDANFTFVNNYGCSPGDYPAGVPGTIAVVKRGNCTFVDKVAMAASFNPVAVIVFNEGNTPDRTGHFYADVGTSAVPAFSTSYFTYQILSNNPSATLSFDISVVNYTAYTMNVIADTLSGRADRVIVVGSHLDSVPAGPGINDNGSGSALNLELALQLASSDNQKKIKNKIRFAWWGAEELGLFGSKYYVYDLQANNQTALSEISLNLNFDMIGSPNFFRGVYNGSSDSQNGSAVIQREFNRYFNSQNIAIQPTEFSGRSDYGPFLNASIPAGGLFTGAEVVKSTAERTLYGGLAGASFDPCYHQYCDTVENIDQYVLTDMSKAAAHVLETLATQDDLHAFLSVA